MRRHIDQLRLDGTDEFISIDTPNTRPIVPEVTETVDQEELSSKIQTKNEVSVTFTPKDSNQVESSLKYSKPVETFSPKDSNPVETFSPKDSNPVETVRRSIRTRVPVKKLDL